MSDLIKLKLKEIQKPISKMLVNSDIGIVLGDAGTGKDFICMYTALTMLLEKKNGYSNLILTKPITETGRSMGFLPGELEDKIKPYRASFDSIINELLPKDNNKAIDSFKKRISFEPVNFVRGNTFKDAIVILTEAQNLTLHELITFVTRLDKSSKMFINGDYKQSDIGKNTGLNNFIQIVTPVHGVNVVELDETHQMRNKMIVEITKNYINFMKKSCKK